jgi:hypothetical protein
MVGREGGREREREVVWKYYDHIGEVRVGREQFDD